MIKKDDPSFIYANWKTLNDVVWDYISSYRRLSDFYKKSNASVATISPQATGIQIAYILWIDEIVLKEYHDTTQTLLPRN